MKKVITLAVFVGVLALGMPAFSQAQTTGANLPASETESPVSTEVLKVINKAVKAKTASRNSRINIISPRGGDTLVTGKTYDLAFKGSRTQADTYRFYLTRDNRDGDRKQGVVGAIYLGTTGDDSHFTFRVPYTVATWPGLGTGYRVVICGKKANSSAKENCSIRGVSAKPFRIVDQNGNDNGNLPPVNIPEGERFTRSQYSKIEITTPNGGEVFEAGQTYDIKWRGGMPNAKVNFSLLTNTGGYNGGFSDAQFTRIITSTENDGFVRWTVPSNLPRTTYKLLVEFPRSYIPGYVDWYVENWDFSDDSFEVVAGNSTSNTQ